MPKLRVINRISLVFMFVCCLPLLSVGQIKGTITDLQRRPIPGAVIKVVSNTSVLSISDINGVFELQWDEFPVRLEVAVLGYKNRVFTVFEDQKEVTIKLTEDILDGGKLLVQSKRINLDNLVKQPISVSSFKAEQSYTSVAASAPELLIGQSGVFVQQTAPGQGSIYVRGRAGRDVLYLFNGLRLNPAFVRSGQNQYFGAIDPFSIEEINVFRGPISVFYGSDALSGGVDVSMPVIPFSKEPETGGRILMQGNFGGTAERSIHARAWHSEERFSWQLQSGFRHFQEYVMPEGTNIDLWFPYDRRLENAGYDFQSLNGSFRFKIDQMSHIEYQGYYSKIPDGARIDQMVLNYDIERNPIPNAPRRAYFSNTAPLTLQTHGLSYTRGLTKSWASNLTIKAAYHRLEDHRKQINFAHPPNFITSDNRFTRSPITEFDKNTSNQWIGALDLKTKITSTFSLNWGADFSYDFINADRYRFNSETDLRTDLDPRFPNGSRVIQGGLFTMAKWAPHQKLNIEGGIRYSHNQTRIPLARAGINSDTDFYKEDFSGITGSLGFSFEAIGHLYFIGNFSSGFRAPNIADLAEVGNRRTNFFQAANPVLGAELTRNYELGLRYNDTGVIMEISGFVLQYVDKIATMPSGRIVDENGVFIRNGTTTNLQNEFIEVFDSNAESMQLFGVETSLNVAPWTNVEFGGTFTYIHGTLNTFGQAQEPVDRIPPGNGLIFVEYRPDRALKLRPQIIYALRQDRISPNEIEDNRVSRFGSNAYMNIQFVAQWAINSQASLNLIGDNLANANYRPHASTLDGLQRNVTLRFSYLF